MVHMKMGTNDVCHGMPIDLGIRQRFKKIGLHVVPGINSRYTFVITYAGIDNEDA
ncbi:hypothetical protein D9M69_578010 [compost metagenome]